MRTCIIATAVSAFLFNISTAFATSAFIEKTNGTATSATLPSNACPIFIRKDSFSGQVFYYFNPEDKLALRAIRIPGFFTDWEVSLDNVEQTYGSKGNTLAMQFWGDENTKTINYAGMREDSPIYEALQKVYPDKNKDCVGYISGPREKFLGIPFDDIDRITFFDDDAKANAESRAFEKKRQAELGKVCITA